MKMETLQVIQKLERLSKWVRDEHGYCPAGLAITIENLMRELRAAEKAAAISDEREAGVAGLRCSDCKVLLGGQHKPSCHRQGMVTETSDYRDKDEVVLSPAICTGCGRPLTKDGACSASTGAPVPYPDPVVCIGCGRWLIRGKCPWLVAHGAERHG